MRKIFNKLKSLYAKISDGLSKVTRGFYNSNIFVALSTIPFYVLVKSSNANTLLIAIYIVLWTFFKCGFFVMVSLERLAETYTKDKSFNWFLWKFTLIFFLLILSFAVDNLLLYDLNNENFRGVANANLMSHFFDFCYYSFMTFTTVGFGEITAASRTAKFYSLIEVFTGFVFVGYILAGYASVREGMIKDKPFDIDYEKEKLKSNSVSRDKPPLE